ncbi:hypothetical protein EHQ61_09550 [Leptospira wolffii]|uniref:hypothetical protein n=1 Tax=Leptospira wolffii TaxID=409998 RepID=UPI0010842FAF|nr:hypothetical protein [Leptospira wolffii]TGL50643.1 hypothetical protein EHQ61_09550 [Leptospira wolffii]
MRKEILFRTLILLFLFILNDCAIDYGGIFPYLSYGNSREKLVDKSYFRRVNRVEYKVRFDYPKDWNRFLRMEFDAHLENKFEEALSATATPWIWKGVKNEAGNFSESGDRLILSFFIGKPKILCEVRTIDKSFSEKNSKRPTRIREQNGTGFLTYEIPIRLEWKKDGSSRKGTYSLVSETEFQGEVGKGSCPSTLDGLGTAFSDASKLIAKRFFPDVKIDWMRFFPESDDEKINTHLSEGYANINGESPDPEAARIHWEEADRISGGKSWEALANLGGYYFIIGYPEEAILYFRKAVALPGAPISYLKDRIRKAEAVEE